jgi:hypothetical protein
MKRIIASVGLCSVFVLAGLLVADDKKSSEPPVKGTLPAGWTKLGLTEPQKKDIYSIEAEYGSKIKDLESQIDKLKKDKYDKMIGVLSDDQKKLLKEIKDPIKDSSASPSSSTDK